MLLSKSMQPVCLRLRCGLHAQRLSYSVSLSLRRASSASGSRLPSAARKNPAKNKLSRSLPEEYDAEGSVTETPIRVKKRWSAVQQENGSEQLTGDNQEEPKSKRTQGSKKMKIKRESMSDYVSSEPASVQHLVNSHDQLKRYKLNPSLMYTVHESVAARLVRALDPTYHHVPHLELGSGPGVLTRALLSAGVTSIKCLENNKAFRKCVEDLSEESGGAVSLVPLNFLSLPKFVAASQLGDNSRLQQCLRGLQPRPWDAPEPCLRVVGVAHQKKFMRYLVHSVLHRQHMFQYGRPELVVFITESEFNLMTASPEEERDYKTYSILTQLLFDVQELDRVPARRFYPWQRAQKRGSVMDSNFVLVRHSPKVNPGVPAPELVKLAFFVAHCTASRHRGLLRQLEQWVPGCGPRLIRLGVEVFAPTRSFSPSQILEVFQEFSSWPEYPASPFHQAAAQVSLGDELDDDVADTQQQLAAEVELCEDEAADEDRFEEEDGEDEVLDPSSDESVFRS